MDADHLDSFDQQLAEVARLLGRGLLRLASEDGLEAAENLEDPLASSEPESVHGPAGGSRRLRDHARES
jgi:hypothetical protein